MADDNMDDHKMLWHLDRVNDWQNGKRIAPIHINAELSKGCDIKCEYCYGANNVNSANGEANYIPREPLLGFMRDAGEIGVRSIALIGEAEPLMNPHVYDAIVEGKKAGVDIALDTNGTMLDNGEKGISALKNLSWIRFNIGAASHEAYERIHGKKLFQNLIENIKFCVETKKSLNLPVTVGLQMVLTPNNLDQAVPLAKLGRELGVDYFVVNQQSDTADSSVLEEARKISTGNYNVTIKWAKIGNEGLRDYDKCIGVPFLLYTSGDGRIYPCGMFFGRDKEEYKMGDLTKQSFKEIVESERYWEVVDKVARIDVDKECYAKCRTHLINDFLWKLKNPPQHVNFV